MRSASFALLLAVALATPLRGQAVDPLDKARRLRASGELGAATAAFEQLSHENPYHGGVWSGLGRCLYDGKQYERAAECFARAVALGHDTPGSYYNATCCLALAGKKDAALAALGQAFTNRFAAHDELASDHDIDSLRDDPRFAELTGLIDGLKTPPAAGRDAGWAWDLDFCVRRMQQMHWNLYAKVGEATFRGEIERLKRDIPPISDEVARVRLQRIVAMVGDGHTQVRLAREGDQRVRLRVHLFAFKEGLYVIGASKEHADLVGARVLRIGPLSADAAMAAVRVYVSADNEMDCLDNGPSLLTVPEVLTEIGAAADARSASLTLDSPGEQPREVRLQPEPVPAADLRGTFATSMVYAHRRMEAPPLYLRHVDRNLHCEVDTAHKLLYFWFGGVQDDADVTIDAMTDRLLQQIAAERIERLVIDMRFNGGGNTGLVQHLVTALAECRAINRRGHLFVIIGRRTFSAAQNTVNMLEGLTAATFVGEPTGSRPRFVGESTSFVLPHSRTRVFCSSRYWQLLASTDDRCWVAPDIVAEPTAADWFAGRDAAMTAIYAAIGG